MESLFLRYEKNKHKIHPIELSAELPECLITIQHFLKGKARHLVF